MIIRIFLLGIILTSALWVRLYKIDVPIADWHSWRQADTAAVARSFLQEGFNPFVPKYNDMSGVAEKPIPNPNRYRMVEFPIYNSITYFTYLITGNTKEYIPRLISIIFSLGSVIFIYLIGRKFFGEMVGLLSALIFSLLPFAIFFSRVVLPEPSLVFYALGMFYFTDRWIWKDKRPLFILAIIFTALAFLTKPFAVFYLIPLLYSYYLKQTKWWPIPQRYIYYCLLSFLPFILWRIWILQYPEGIPASNWLFNGTDIRFHPAFFRWIIGERIGGEILGVAGSILLVIGAFIKPKIGQNYLPFLLLLSVLSYLVIIATGNVQHDYYQYLIVPVLCIFVARGFTLLFSQNQLFFSRIITIPLAVFLLGLTFYLPWQEVKGLYQINNGVIVEAGQKADQLLPKQAVVVAPYNGDTSFLYYVNRPGWAFLAYPIEDLISYYKVTHYVSVNFDQQTKEIMNKYQVLEKNDKFVIVDVSKFNEGYRKGL